eukprot:gene20978-26908_t
MQIRSWMFPAGGKGLITVKYGSKEKHFLNQGDEVVHMKPGDQ